MRRCPTPIREGDVAGHNAVLDGARMLIFQVVLVQLVST
jgi:hypothetical protein